MITVALSATIDAPRERVWRALVDPTQREAWDERVLGAVDLPPDSKSAGGRRHAMPGRQEPIRRTSWRFRLGGVPLVMKEEIVGADRHDRIASRISIGSLHFDQRLTLLTEKHEAGPRTGLGMTVVVSNSITVIGEVIPRLDVQRLVIEYVDATLKQIQKYCEAGA